MTKKNAQKVAARARQVQHGGSYQANLRTVKGAEPAGSPWICDGCRAPIPLGGGYVLIMDHESKGYPAGGPPKEGASVEEWIRDGQRLQFRAYHSDCDPHPDEGPYWFDVDRAATLEQWCKWVWHLTEKTWMSKRDIARLIEFWFANRGQDLHHHMR